MNKNILMVVTNVAVMGETHPTGLWLEEFALPYLAFAQAGYRVVVASPAGGKIPLDPNSTAEGIPAQWQPALAVLEDSVLLAEQTEAEFDAIVLPGGHGPMFDLATDPTLAALLTQFMESGKVVGAVCHGPAALVSAVRSDGQSILANRNVTGFSNQEEVATTLDALVPFLLEDKLKELGAQYANKEAWQEHVVSDGNLITGQNPQSSALFAQTIVNKLQN